MRAPLLALALTAAATAAFAAPAEVRERKDGAGIIYADAQDRTLYVYAQDKPGTSLCNDVCARAWPPLMAPDTAQGDAVWSVIKRADGKSQWALNGKPVYTFAKDLPGTSFGEGAGNLAWRVALSPILTPPGVTLRQSVLGRILIDRNGNTLYQRGDGKACAAKCLDDFTPLIAPLAAKPKGDWTMVARDDGARQWAYQGKPLYTYIHESKPGEIEGHGRDKVWQAAVLSPAPGEPSWVTVHPTDLGEVFADASGRTLYVQSSQRDGERQESRRLVGHRARRQEAVGLQGRCGLHPQPRQESGRGRRRPLDRRHRFDQRRRRLSAGDAADAREPTLAIKIV